MHARVSMLEGPADQLDAGLDTMRGDILRQLEDVDGFKGVLFLGNRTNGKSIAVTLWESEGAMQASREAANAIRQEAADAESASIMGVEEFEILMDEKR
jgi:heme-degrading monooxygenase HmoA